MRITAYPRATGIPSRVSDAIKFGIARSHAYRDEPLPIAQRKLLYANDLLPAGSELPAGQSNTFRRVIDFDSRTMKLARLSVDAFFITSPSVDKVYTCPLSPGAPQKSSDDGASFQDEISKPMNQNGAQFLCREIRLIPRNAIHEMVGDRPSFAIFAIFSDSTQPNEEYPRLLMWWGANGQYPPNLNSLQYQKVSAANPTMMYDNMAVEYSPSGESAPPKQK